MVMSIQINNAKTFRYLFFVFLIVIALFFLSNIGFMLLRSVKYRKIAFENDKQLTELGLVRIEDNYRFEPYTHWMHQPYSSDAINIAESGYRNGWKSDDLSNTDTSETFSIYIFGGSTVWGEGVNDNETIPSWLARTLADRGFSDVNVHNLAVKAYCSTQEMIQFIILLRDGYRPDLVVFYDGVNDVFSPVLDGEPGSPIGLSNLRKIYNNAENTKSDRHEIRKWLSNVISLFTEAPFINWLRRKLINTDEPEAYDISDRNRIAKEVEAIYFLKAMC